MNAKFADLGPLYSDHKLNGTEPQSLSHSSDTDLSADLPRHRNHLRNGVACASNMTRHALSCMTVASDTVESH